VATRYFVILLGRGTVDETLDFVEEKHGKVVVEKVGEEEERLQAKLHMSNCKNFVYGVVEISKKEAVG
jgi:hypothetical protein